MQYKALYRKYRPINFDDVCGQEYIVKTLTNSISNDKISHAYLFCGPRGSGKTSIAKIFAKAINCQDNKNGNACGKCEMCLQIENNITSDIIEIDAASNNGVDEIREIRNKVNLLPTICKYKVYIIDEVHMLSTGAFNALLKTLEEPPKHVIFILATTESHKIPSTILSRCQRFDFKRITPSVMYERLKYISQQEDIKIADEALHKICSISDGGLRDAIGMLDQASSYSSTTVNEIDIDDINGNVSNAEIKEFLQKILAYDSEYIIEKIGKYAETGKNLVKFTEDLISLIRNNLVGIAAPLYYKNIYDANDLIKDISKQEMYNLIKNLNTMFKDLQSSSYPKIVLEVTLLEYIDNNINKKANETEVSKPKKIIETHVDSSAVPMREESLKIIKMEMKSKKVVDLSKIEELTKIRINNAFATASKDKMKDIKNIWCKINQYSLDKELENAAGVLLDANLRVVGSECIVISYPYETIVERSNKLILEIEQILNKLTNSEYKVICISDENWELEKEQYIKKTKEGYKFEILEENIDYLIDEVNNDAGNEDNIFELLGEVVEIK